MLSCLGKILNGKCTLRENTAFFREKRINGYVFFMHGKVHMSMRCQKCGEETFLPFQCPYCGGQFCAAHRLPENHNCPKMALARAPKQEETAMPQAPSDYKYTVTFGHPQRAKGRIYFSPKELKHLAVAALMVVAIGLSTGLYSDTFAQVEWFYAVGAFTAILTVSFFLHELAHKFTAQRQGLWAEFRLTLWGAALTLVSVLTPLFKIISPGAVMISGAARKGEIGKISIAGPATNLVLSMVMFGLAFAPTLYVGIFFFGAFFNAWLAVFNLLPVGILDGYKIFSWDRRVWALAFAAAVALVVPGYLMASSYVY
jgi:Zn-dependent protease